MATNLTTTTFNTTYKDDFRDSDNYHRILFNSGKALQARELTQLQTIIQSEIGRFGNNIFREGGMVKPGGLSLSRINFVKLAAGQLPTNTADIIGKDFTVATPNPQLIIKVLEVIPSSGSDPDTLVVQYVSTSAGTSGSSSVAIGNANTLQNSTLGSSYDMVTASTAAAGQGLRFSIAEGVFFAQGHFVFCEKQTINLSKYTISGSYDVGFKIIEDVVTITDTDALYDNQGAVPNIAAPGADRYRIRLVLTTRDAITSGENFIFLTKVNGARITDTTTTENSYNILNDTLALRTKEESGDYIVKPFNAKFNDLNDSTLELEVSDGVVYIDGYRLDMAAEKINVSKAQSTIAIANESIVVQYGNYVLGGTNKGLPNISAFERLEIRSAVTYGGDFLGTCRVRSVEEDGSFHRYYLFDIRMAAGSSFGSARSIGTSATSYFDLNLVDGVAQLVNTAQNDLLFPLPRPRPTQTGTSYDAISVQERYTVTTDGAGASTSSVSVTSGTFENTGQWIIAPTDGPIETPTITFTDGTQTAFNITGASASKTLEILAKVNKGSPTVRTKVLNDTSLTIAWPGDANTDSGGQQFIDLDKTDIFSLDAVKISDSDGADISQNWILDNGQRDNFYGFGKLILKGGLSAPTSNIFVRFKHFTHTSGNFFDVSSYPTATVPYKDIPIYQQNDGQSVPLRDVADFRPVATKTGSLLGGIGHGYDSDGGGNAGIINLLPTNTETFTGDITYYMPRRDRLVATAESTRKNSAGYQVGKVQVLTGVSDLDPEQPQVTTNSMLLMNIDLNPFTLNESDLSTTIIPNKRFTMSDIAELEQRIDTLQELTTLSLLELNTSSLSVLDSSGNARTKAGFLVDNFKDYRFAAINSGEYRAVIDDLEGVLTPEQHVRNVRMLFDSADAATTTTLKGDLVILPISSQPAFVNQNLATGTLNVNPFAVITHNGVMRLSPASDEWVETRYAPDVIVNATEIVNGGSRVVNSIGAWRNSWIGRPSGNTVTVRGSVTTRREVIADKVIDVQIIPFMRSKKVYFKAEGLRPSTRHFSYFNNIAIDAYTRGESFQTWSRRRGDDGNTYTNSTSHPSGTTTLISDAEGKLTGSFIIPSNSSLKFRTGSKLFKLLDITGGNSDEALSKTSNVFTSSGVLETRQRTIRNTRVEQRLTLINAPPPPPPDNNNGGGGDGDNGGSDPGDPLAQTFYISGKENPNGIFITKVDAFLSTKDSVIPIRGELRGVENGIPNSIHIPDAYAYVKPADVNLPTDINSMSAVRAAPTTFEFPEPVFLLPDREYAFVLKAETIEYNAYVAETYDFVLGSTEARVNRQPTLGSLFTSQNGFTWTPDQSKDLMFKLYRAEFSASGDAILENASVPSTPLFNNPLLTTAGDATVRVFQACHGFIKNDKVRFPNIDSAEFYGGIAGYHLSGSRTVTAVDWTGYTFEADSTASSTVRTGGDGLLATQNMMFDNYVPNVQTLLPNSTNITAQIKLTNGASYANNRNTSTGYSRAKDTNFSTLLLNDFNTNDEPQAIFSDSNEAALLGAKSTTLKLTLSTQDTKVTPIVDLQRASITTFENVIDKQHASNTNGFNVPIGIVPETHPSQGTAAAKHVTVPVTLEEQAVGLKILFAAHRPLTGSFDVYFKVGTAETNFDEINWVEIKEFSNNPADANPGIFRDYEFLPGGQGGFLDAFTKFQVKIVLNSTNSSKIPIIKDLRAIAMVT